MVETPIILHLFQGFGIELEYMIVDADSLAVLPVTDEVLRAVAGEYVMEVESGALAWSNELALHVIELKTNGPATQLTELPQLFQGDVQRINALLAPLGGRLMPAAMHPWMNPATETRLWPHEDSPIYRAFDRIFGCRGHGWSNLQSVHINLPFADDREFARLHAAVRLVLPILPALAASSPIVEWRPTGLLDTRLEVYRNNARRIPSVSGQIIPEPVYSRHDYETGILQRIYRDLEPHDPKGVLLYEWVNARGAIARFDRNTIEIRVLDIQECPRADLAYAALIIETVQAHVEEHWATLIRQQRREVGPLYRIFSQCVAEAEQAVIRDRRYLDLFGFPERGAARAGDVWQHLIETLFAGNGTDSTPWRDSWHTYLNHGSLARRILRAVGDHPEPKHVRATYATMCESLEQGKAFVG
jgi:gamma-glutamyl:cysteine ligase YbdK (ATP-grasp superfamily)